MKINCILIILAIISMCNSAAAEDLDLSSATRYQQEMRKSPDMVSPDAVYLGYSIDKVYYQNQAVTQLVTATNQILEELREMIKRLSEDVGDTAYSISSSGEVDVSGLENQNRQILSLLKEIRDMLAEKRE